MQALITLIEQHEDWLTDRVVHYAQQRDFTQYSSTLREAWRISIRGLGKPLAEFLQAAQNDCTSKEQAVKAATEFGITQGIQHRARGVELDDFLGLLKLYRNAFLDLAADKAESPQDAWCFQRLILEQFDAVEEGLFKSWRTTPASDHLQGLQTRNRELTNEKNKYLTVFESIAEPAILLAPDRRPTHVNAAANKILLGEVEPGASYYGEVSNPLLLSIIQQLFDGVEKTPGPITLDTPNGRRTFEVSIQEMLDISKKFAGSVVIFQDVTDYRKAVEAAQEADRAKSIFLDTVSHEIRTPINSILGLTGMLQKGDLPSETLKHLRSIRASGEVLSALIENVLGLSRAEANALQLVEHSFDLSDLCLSLFQVLELNNEQHRIPLKLEIAPDVPTQLLGDGHKLRHVLMNLLANALKYTEAGTVTLSISETASNNERERRLHFSVTDTGCGIPQEEVGTLFDPFVQANCAVGTCTAKGSGLGLAISRHLVEFMGGTIAYHPNPEGGSIFGFDVPFQLSTQQSRPTRAAGYNILVVEDDPVNAVVVEGYLSALGNSVTLAQNFAEAQSALKVQTFDVVITDYRLGSHSGLDVVNLARATSETAERIMPVLLMTAALPQDALSKLRQSPAVLVLEKPFSRKELAAALSNVCKPVVPQDCPVTEDKPSSLSRKDLNRLLSDLGYDRCINVVSSFQTNLPSMISGMQMQLKAGDITGMRELLHRLVSASGFVGGKRLVEKAVGLSKACNAQDIEATQEGVNQLILASESLMRELGNWCETVHASR